MRFAAALLLVALPISAGAQPRPPDRNSPAHEPPAHKPNDHKPTKPAATKPPATKPGPAKPAPAKPAPAKPGPAKPAPAKPVASRPAPPAVAPPVKPAPEEPHQGKTGLPLPRFAALKSDDVNFRRGPGDRYPIEWVYKRRDLPVEIEREFDAWRLVSDPQGTKGWVHSSNLTGRRTAIVVGGEHVLRQATSDAAGAVAKLDQGVILRVRSCEAKSEWCQVSIGDYRGFVKRAEVWGTLPGEAIQ